MREDAIAVGPAAVRVPDRRAAMRAAMRRDMARSRERGEVQRFGRSGRMRMQVDQDAFLNAVLVEGQQVVHDQGYWEDMRRRHPFIDADPDRSTRPVHVMRNRHGRVSWRKVYG